MRILVTRPEAQSQSLIDAINQQGHQALALPLLNISPITAKDAAAQAIKSQILKLDEYDHVIFISTNAAKLAIDWVDLYWPQLPMQRWYGIGNATTAILQAYKPETIDNGLEMNSEALVKLETLQHIQGQKILIMRGVGGRDFLFDTLSARGASVSYCELYERKAMRYAKGTLSQLLNSGIEMLTLSSVETIQSLCDQAMIDGVYREVQQISIVVPGNRVAQYATEQGFTKVIIAANAGLEAMLNAINN